ncbi:hypothetical protein F5883DRAFT_665902 [Diaporthe sp. PMI_573]|nr:hypothetical protein F5883DRAFT_665902 [Diaporthaceae sp. PMI_573]
MEDTVICQAGNCQLGADKNAAAESRRHRRLKEKDNKIIQIALQGLENILKVGEVDKQAVDDTPDAINRYALLIDECGGIEKIHECQTNANEEIYKKTYNIIEKYFSGEDKKADDGTAQAQGPNGTFGFGAGANGGQGAAPFNFSNTNENESIEM